MSVTACLQLYTPSRTLRSASDTLSLQIPRTRLSTVGSRAFSVFGRSGWNDLLPLRLKPSLDSVEQLSRTVRKEIENSKRRTKSLWTRSSKNLKTFLFQHYRPAVFSVPCCFHPSQLCLLPVLSCMCKLRFM